MEKGGLYKYVHTLQKLPLNGASVRVARWYIFRPKILTLGKLWSVLQCKMFGKFYGQ
jgi:hypothetical protein